MSKLNSKLSKIIYSSSYKNETNKIPYLTTKIMDSIESEINFKTQKSKRTLYTDLKSWFFSPFELKISKPYVAIGLLSILIFTIFSYEKNFNQTLQENQTTPIKFIFKDTTHKYKTIFVIGSFNEWNNNSKKLTYNKKTKNWECTINLPHGEYEYAFWINNERSLPDPNANLYIDDNFGSKNSIIKVDSNRINNIKSREI